jgi:hypothetical protein
VVIDGVRPDMWSRLVISSVSMIERRAGRTQDVGFVPY